jgi:hypothetical protein
VLPAVQETRQYFLNGGGVEWGVWVPGEGKMKPRERKKEILMLNSSEKVLFCCITEPHPLHLSRLLIQTFKRITVIKFYHSGEYDALFSAM